MTVKFRGLKLLGFVAAAYAALALFWPDKTLHALAAGSRIFVELLLVFPLIILLTALIDYRFDAKSFARHLGKDSGVRGWLIALGAGILSHGPMYAWYPMFEEIKSHGVRYGLIAAFFYARSIKVPLLPIMVDYFGLAFTVILTLYILLAAWLQGLLIEWLCSDCNH
jgi:uncharacterized membrane protein YraQ (UPF0718 family)